MKKEDDFLKEFKDLEGSWDIETPQDGHRERFLEKVAQRDKKDATKRRFTWWKPLSAAAAIFIGGLVAFQSGVPTMGAHGPSSENRVAVAQTQSYFSHIIEEQIAVLKDETNADTAQIIEDTLVELEQLETDNKKLQGALKEGGNSKMIMRAMVVNFQTRIALLEDVLEKIETINSYKNIENEDYTL